MLPVNDGVLWTKMRAIGNLGSADFSELFPGQSDQAIANIGVDYRNIVWWADGMKATGDRLTAIRKVLDHPGVSRTDPEFVAAQKALASQLAKLAALTEKNFGGPWGLLAMRLAAPVAGRRFMLLNPHLSLAAEKPLPLAAKNGGQAPSPPP